MAKSKTHTITEVMEAVENKGFSQAEYINKLEKDNYNLSEGLKQASDKLIQMQEEIVHLKSMLVRDTPAIDGILAPMSDEELIADMQLRILSERARRGELTLEEIKKYDLLVKNKRLAQGNATTINADKGPKKELPTSKLLEIASHKKTEER